MKTIVIIARNKVSAVLWEPCRINKFSALDVSVFNCPQVGDSAFYVTISTLRFVGPSIFDSNRQKEAWGSWRQVQSSWFDVSSKHPDMLIICMDSVKSSEFWLWWERFSTMGTFFTTSPLYEFSDEQPKKPSLKKLFHILCNHMASHVCEFSDGQ